MKLSKQINQGLFSSAKMLPRTIKVMGLQFAFIVFGTLSVPSPAVSQLSCSVANDPLCYSRKSAFTYEAVSGLLKTETLEPDNPALCVLTTYTYDPYGNKQSAVTSSCTGVPAASAFASRTTSSNFRPAAVLPVTVAGQANVVSPKGLFPQTSTNALTQTETKTFDPRFGAVLSLLGPNGLTTSWEVDDFGRKTRELRADGTSTVNAYCIVASAGVDISSNSAACAGFGIAANEIPADAFQFVHSEPRNNANAKMGPFGRVYSDRLGRTIRSVTESFDGAQQPASGTSVIVKDTTYSAVGTKITETQPYFLGSGSSTVVNAGAVGLSVMTYDVLGRPVSVAVTDPLGLGSVILPGTGASTSAAVTRMVYSGQTVTTTNDKSQVRVEEKNAEGQIARITDALGAQLAHQYDAFGNLIQTKDARGNLILVQFDTRGRKTQMTDPDTGTWGYCYDALGQLKAQQSPNMRTSQTSSACPANTGSTVAAVAVAQWTTMAYDVLGRLTQRIEPEYTSTWTFDKYASGAACNKGVGKLCEVVTSNGVNRKMVYDSLGRPVNTRTTITSGPSFAAAVAYDGATGRVASQLYPTGLQVLYSYTSRGFLEKLTLGTAITVNPLPSTVGAAPSAGASLAVGSVLWQAQAVNAWGKVEQQSVGNGVITKATFDTATGRIAALSAGASSATNVLSYAYVWDSINNLTDRTDNNGVGVGTAVTDRFTYDKLNRLTQYKVDSSAIANLSRTVDLQYNALGSLLYKSDVGVYSYGLSGAGAVRPHALQTVARGTDVTNYNYDLNGNLTSASAGRYRTVAYTSFNQPDGNTGITGPGGNNGSTAISDTWSYDENHARIKQVHTVTGGVLAGTRTTWYLHPDAAGGLSFESEVNSPSSASASNPSVTSNRHYISAGGQVIGVLVSTGALPTLAAAATAPAALSTLAVVKLEYWHKDHLGSLVSTTDHAGTVTERYAYDPFGKRRYTSGVYDAFGALVVDWSSAVNKGTARGFTGHEMLDDVGLIHMNGRLFDPALGVFLQGDPIIQSYDELQNYNRYIYCFNNPLTCTDPTGYRNKFVSFLFSLGATVLCGPLCGIWTAQQTGLIDTRTARLLTGLFLAPFLGGANGLVAAITGFTSPILITATSGFILGAITTGTLKGAIQGAFTAGAFQFAGDAIAGSGAFAGSQPLSYGQGIVIHAVVGCVTSVASGSKCGPGALSAAFSKAIGQYTGTQDRVFGTIISAVVGGTASALGGGKFANGAKTAAFGYVFNELLHQGESPNQAMKRSGYLPTNYSIDGIVCNSGAPGCVERGAGPLTVLTPKQSAELASNLADGAALVSLVVFPPAAPVFGYVGLGADVYKFSLTGDFGQLLIDAVIPQTFLRGFRSLSSQLQELLKEASSQFTKSFATDVRDQRIKNEGVR